MSKNTVHEQRSQEWHKQRVGKITGSVAGAALGVNPYMTQEALIRRMVRDAYGLDSEFTGNIATEYGSMNEPLAMLGYTLKTGNAVNEVGFFVHPVYEWLGASPDGIVNTEYGYVILEIKCPFSLRNDLLPEFKSIEQQPHYYAQLQLEMACTGIKETHFYQWNKHGDSLEIVPFCQKWFDDAIHKLYAFYQRFLNEIDNPIHCEPLVKQIDSKSAELLLAEYDHLAETIDNATQRKAEILAKLVDMADSKNSLVCGRKLTLVKRDGSISYSKAIKDLLPNADLSSYQGKPTTYWKLS
jgi:putative phage-type endonuclease